MEELSEEELSEVEGKEDERDEWKGLSQALRKIWRSPTRSLKIMLRISRGSEEGRFGCISCGHFEIRGRKRMSRLTVGRWRTDEWVNQRSENLCLKKWLDARRCTVRCRGCEVVNEDIKVRKKKYD